MRPEGIAAESTGRPVRQRLLQEESPRSATSTYRAEQPVLQKPPTLAGDVERCKLPGRDLMRKLRLEDVGRPGICGSLLRGQHHADPEHASGVIYRRCDRVGAGFGRHAGLLA